MSEVKGQGYSKTKCIFVVKEYISKVWRRGSRCFHADGQTQLGVIWPSRRIAAVHNE